MLCRQPVVFQLFRDKVTFGNLLFLFCQIAADFDDFHPVTQGGFDGAQVVGSGNEHDFRQVVVHIQEVVVERIVLFRVKYFEECRLRVATEVCSHFVYFVEDKDGVGRAGFLDVLQDTSGHGANISLPVSPDFSFVVQPAERHAYKLAVDSFCH